MFKFFTVIEKRASCNETIFFRKFDTPPNSPSLITIVICVSIPPLSVLTVRKGETSPYSVLPCRQCRESQRRSKWQSSNRPSIEVFINLTPSYKMKNQILICPFFFCQLKSRFLQQWRASRNERKNPPRITSSFMARSDSRLNSRTLRMADWFRCDEFYLPMSGFIDIKKGAVVNIRKKSG